LQAAFDFAESGRGLWLDPSVTLFNAPLIESANLTYSLEMRLKVGEIIMTTKVRTLLTFTVVGAACTIGSAAYGENGAVETNGKTATADNICAGVPAKEREMGLLAFRDNIVSIAPLNEFKYAGKAKYSHTEGVVIKLRATPGISVPWLERVNGCHVAMAGAGHLSGYDAASDPFILSGTTVTASEVYAGYVLSVRAANYNAVQELLQRSYALISTPGGPKTASLESR
jgi:hypothetical protein